MKSDVTRRDHVSVVMDAGSRIVNFIRDGTVTLKYTTLVRMRSGYAWTNTKTTERKWRTASNTLLKSKGH